MKLKKWYRLISLLCVTALIGSGMTGYAKADNADAASKDAVSANFVDGLGDYYDDEVEADSDEEWERYFEFGGSDGTAITKYIGPFSKVVIPAKATKIVTGAFDNANMRITSISFEEGSVCTTIDNSVFANCTKLSSITFSKNMTTLGDSAFRNTGLREIIIPDSVRQIGSYAFADNKELISATLGKGVENIGMRCFSGSDKFREIKIDSKQLESADENIFEGTALKSIIFTNSVERIPAMMFYNTAFLPDTEIVIPGSVWSIGEKAFYGTKNLNITFESDGLKIVENSAFEGSDISVVNLSSKVEFIGKRAFAGCENIKEMKIPAKCLSIGDSAFEGCKGLRKVYITRRTEEIDKDAFKDCNSITFYVLKNSPADLWAQRKKYNIVYAHTINYKLNKGMNNPANPTMFVTGESAPLYDPVRPGFTFGGWYTSSNYKEKVTTVNSTKKKLKLYAKWVPITYEVKYELNGSDVDNTKNEKRTSRNCLKKFKLYKPKREGYKFGGWFMDTDFSGEEYKNIPVDVDRNVVVYAKWVESGYGVVFHANGGVILDDAGRNGVLDPIEHVAFSESFVMPRSNVFESRADVGFQHTGWNLDPEGTRNNGKGTHYDFGQKTSRLTTKNGAIVYVYAEWTPIEYDVNYILDGGTNNVENPLKHTVTEVVTLKKPEKPGCVFKGWYADAQMTERIYEIPKNYPHSITVYAKWD